MNEPTPDEAAAALRTVREGREQVIKSAWGARWMSIAGGLVVFLYCVAIDLLPGTGGWLTWVVLAGVVVAAVGLRTRVGGTLLGRAVVVSGRSLPLTFTSRLLRTTPVLVLGAAAVVAGCDPRRCHQLTS